MEAKSGPRIEKDIDPPVLLVDDQTTGRLWHRLDDRYALPKSVLTLLIRTASVEHIRVDGSWQPDVTAAIHSSLLGSIFSEAMAVDTYDADLAGLHWNLGFTSSGIKISCAGFSDRLPDLALRILEAFLMGEFIKESYFTSTKDRVCRGLRTFFQSRRADSNAMYYRDLLLTSSNGGIGASLSAAEATTLDSVKCHHQQLFSNPDWELDCLFTGNVSEKEAKEFFSTASQLTKSVIVPSSRASGVPMWYPGEMERRVPGGDDVELHFPSQNESDENGAIVMTYQSPIPGYRGNLLSNPESLKSSASLRLIGHILREPLFDELRTKQSLGYVVSSWFDIGISSRPPNDLHPMTVPVDFLVIAVLSRKLSPVDIAGRIDDFLVAFRQILLEMPASELESYAAGLSTKLRKPILKLGTEASAHFSKITSYAPEILLNGLTSTAIPWDNAKAMANQITTLQRQDLVDTWDRLMLPSSRARVTTFVYGSTFPLDPSRISSSMQGYDKRVVVDNLCQVLTLRSELRPFDNTATLPAAGRTWKRVVHQVTSKKALLGVATVAAMGAIGWTVLSREKKAISAGKSSYR
jgi:insulysin